MLQCWQELHSRLGESLVALPREFWGEYRGRWNDGTDKAQQGYCVLFCHPNGLGSTRDTSKANYRFVIHRQTRPSPSAVAVVEGDILQLTCPARAVQETAPAATSSGPTLMPRRCTPLQVLVSNLHLTASYRRQISLSIQWYLGRQKSCVAHVVVCLEGKNPWEVTTSSDEWGPR